MSAPIPTSKALLACWKQLDDTGRDTLLSLAEFLVARLSERNRPVPEPVLEPRPESESVVAALKRLSRCYHMLDRSKMLSESSALMGQHVMEGRAAREVIDELEILFRRHYRSLTGRG